MQITRGETHSLSNGERLTLPNVAGETRIISMFVGTIELFDTNANADANEGGIRLDANDGDRNSEITFVDAAYVVVSRSSKTVFTLSEPIAPSGGGSSANGATEATLVATLSELRDDVQISETVWRSKQSGSFYIRQTRVEQDTQTQTVVWSDLTGASVPAPAIADVSWVGSDAPTSSFRNETVTSPVMIAVGARSLLALNLINLNNAPVYVKIFDVATLGAITLGTTVPAKTIAVPSAGALRIETNEGVGNFSTGIAIACTTGQLLNTNAFPALGILIEGVYV